MILVDANLLLYAEDSLHPNHQQARAWWDGQLSGAATVCLCWTVLSAFIRIGTNPRVFEQPLSLDQALARIQSWLDQPCTRIVRPTERHWAVFQNMLTDGQAVAKSGFTYIRCLFIDGNIWQNAADGGKIRPAINTTSTSARCEPSKAGAI